MSKSLPIAHHVTTRLEEDRALAQTPIEQRLLARVVLDLGREGGLLGFCVADTHLHLVLALARDAAQAVMRRLEIALQLRLRYGSPFERARPRPIFNVWHLARALSYLHTQQERHGLVGFDAGEATSLPDLLEMRPRGSYLIPRVRRHLPRLTRDDLLGQVGRKLLAPAQGPPSLVRDAACRAAALPHLSGKGQETIAARRAAWEVLRTGLDFVEASRRLGLSRASAYRLALRPVAPTLVKAIELQLGWLTDARPIQMLR